MRAATTRCRVKLYPLSYNVRVWIYHLWQAASALVIAYGVIIPHTQLWEQLIIVLLGLGYGGAAHVALKRTVPDPDANETPRTRARGLPTARTPRPASALEALEQAVQQASS